MTEGRWGGRGGLILFVNNPLIIYCNERKDAGRSLCRSSQSFSLYWKFLGVRCLCYHPIFLTKPCCYKKLLWVHDSYIYRLHILYLFQKSNASYRRMININKIRININTKYHLTTKINKNTYNNFNNSLFRTRHCTTFSPL